MEIDPTDPRLEGLDSDELIDEYLAAKQRPVLDQTPDDLKLAGLVQPLDPGEVKLMRDVYLDGGYRLQLIETNERAGSHTYVRALLFDPEGRMLMDTHVGVPAGVVIDSDEVVRSAISAVTMQPDPDEPNSYTRRQQAFVDNEAEHLSLLYCQDEDRFDIVEWDERPGFGL